MITQTIDTFTTAEWSYRHKDYCNDSGTSALDGRPSCMVSSAENMLEQIANMRAQGYQLFAIVLHTYCSVCQGTGRVPKRSRTPYAYKVCTACKGHEGPITTTPYDLT